MLERRGSMDCTKFLEDMSMYLDNMSTDIERIEFERHLEACKDCRIQFNNFKTMLECVNDIDEIELPSDFETTLHNKLVMEIEKDKKKARFPLQLKVVSGIAAAIAVVVISVTLTNQYPIGRGMKSAQEDSRIADYKENVEGEYGLKSPQFTTRNTLTDTDSASPQAPQENFINMDQSGAIVGTSIEVDRKIIKQGSLRIETDAFDASYNKIINMVENKLGFVQHSQTYYRVLDRENPDASLRSSYMTLRIPNNDFTETFNQIKGFGKVINENIGGQDVTEAYRDMEREVENLELQEERFRDILKKADKVEDILRIENELARVRSQINNLKANLNNFDKQVSMSTLNLELEEVKTLDLRIQSTNDGVWKRAKINFIKTINNIIDLSERGFIGLFGMLPALVILGALGGPLSIYAYKQIKKRRN